MSLYFQLNLYACLQIHLYLCMYVQMFMCVFGCIGKCALKSYVCVSVHFEVIQGFYITILLKFF